MTALHRVPSGNPRGRASVDGTRDWSRKESQQCEKYRIAAAVIGGLFLAPSAMAQGTHLAYASAEPQARYMVFLEKGNSLPKAGVPAVRSAVAAAKAGKTIEVVGRADQAQIVKQEMIREGAPAGAIVVANAPATSLPQADAIGDTASRKVEIKY